MNEICKCSFCGYEWLRGRDGSHDCYEAMTKTIKSQAERIERLNDRIESDRKLIEILAKLVRAVKRSLINSEAFVHTVDGKSWWETREEVLGDE